MRILIAEDDLISCRVLETTLTKWNHEVVVTHDGAEAWAILQQKDAPRLAVIDWMMPELDGIEICRKVRALGQFEPTYIILLTAKGGKDNIVLGLESGADDYITKPFDRDELRARLNVGQRLVEVQHNLVQLQKTLADRVQELEEAMAQVKHLSGLLPICAWCKKIRNDQNYWQKVEDYISLHTLARFTHGICPECMQQMIEKDKLKLALGRRKEEG